MSTDCPVTIVRNWLIMPGLMRALKQSFSYGPGEDRATGYLYAWGETEWPQSLATLGPQLMTSVGILLGQGFTHVVFQAYLNGSGCDWHADTPFDAQAILSLGTTRSLQVRQPGAQFSWHLNHGDLLYMPPRFQDHWEHRVPVQDILGERCSMVFRTVRK